MRDNFFNYSTFWYAGTTHNKRHAERMFVKRALAEHTMIPCSLAMVTSVKQICCIQKIAIARSFNDFTLIATDVPNNQFGVFYYGPSQTEQVFGEGYRCVGEQTTRLSVVNTGPLGFATSPIDNTEAPHAGQITPGSTWNFQFWYRDPQGGAAGYNLTDALQVTFCE